MAKWNYSVIQRGSKLGIHGIRPNNAGAFVQQAIASGARLPVVKAVSDLGWLRGIKEASPETIIVGRVSGSFEGVSEHQLQGDLRQLAEDIMAHTTEKVQYHGDDVDYWEPTNESDPPGADNYRRFAEFHFYMMDIAEREGYKIGLFTFNAGTPEYDEMEAIVETGVFARAKQGGHILTLHEGVFGRDPVDRWYGGSLPGAPGSCPDRGALCFRYRWLYRDFLEPRNEVIPLVVSEIVFGGGYSQDGISPAEVVRRARWYDERAREDYYVLAFLPFTLGPTGGWSHQNYEWAYPALVDYMISIKDEPNALPSEEPGYRGQPRVQYERTYVLLPLNADAAWARVVVEGAWDQRRYTIGGSADDAGIGDLDVRRVIAVNPQEWPGPLSLEEFYAQYYPGVEYQAITAASPEELAQKLASE
jgi:hypothetical protein